jgi:hypothetical protein
MATTKLRSQKPGEFIAALKDAEKAYATAEKPQEPGQIVRIAPGDIYTDTSIFQPREFSYGWRDVDKKHVAKLVAAIGNTGELDPIAVVRLWPHYSDPERRGQWYVVDGHHRLAAYQQLKWKDPLKCVWLGGTRLRDILTEALRSNVKTTLPLDNTTRQNAAWRYTLLDSSMSKAEVARSCNISPSQVANMRRVARAFKEPDQCGTDFSSGAPEGCLRRTGSLRSWLSTMCLRGPLTLRRRRRGSRGACRRG